ncbi:hypothetical protein M513_04771 [Trichuris suis]|uniref:Uncharacterized protein n=1 Tax=Trichuris suis TaxID=68888 RepID=A0A085MB32_9BILA|nr:hypothetical protein M513_04771 [Trichuris suis]
MLSVRQKAQKKYLMPVLFSNLYNTIQASANSRRPLLDKQLQQQLVVSVQYSPAVDHWLQRTAP